MVGTVAPIWTRYRSVSKITTTHLTTPSRTNSKRLRQKGQLLTNSPQTRHHLRGPTPRGPRLLAMPHVRERNPHHSSHQRSFHQSPRARRMPTGGLHHRSSLHRGLANAPQGPAKAGCQSASAPPILACWSHRRCVGIRYMTLRSSRYASASLLLRPRGFGVADVLRVGALSPPVVRCSRTLADSVLLTSFDVLGQSRAGRGHRSVRSPGSRRVPSPLSTPRRGTLNASGVPVTGRRS
jgi:hypothetical protein